MDRVPAGAELVGEGGHPGRQPLGVVEEQDLSHAKTSLRWVGAGQLYGAAPDRRSPGDRDGRTVLLRAQHEVDERHFGHGQGNGLEGRGARADAGVRRPDARDPGRRTVR